MKKTILLCLVFGLKAIHHAESQTKVDNDNTDIYDLQKATKPLYDMITALHQQVDDQNQKLNDLRQIIDEQSKYHNQASSTYNAANNGTKRLTNKHLVDSSKGRLNYYKMTEIQYNRFLSFGCLSDVIHLSCGGEKLINVTSAFYGDYHDTFNNTCPVPHPIDECQEYVPSSRPADWVALKVSCDNRTECDFQYRGSTFLNECTIDKTAHFMMIYYSCMPDNLTFPIGFSAHPSQNRQELDGDQLLFDVVKINLGSHYQQQASVFICPVNGLYLISVNVNSQLSYSIYVYAHVEERRIDRAYAHGISNHYSQAAMTTIAECSAGERIWLACIYSGYLLGDDISVFTVYLLDSYN